MPLAWFASFLILPALTQAAPYCRPAGEVLRSVEFCESNVVFAEEADHCLRKFQREIDANQARLALQFAAHARETREAQDEKFRNTARDLVDTNLSLDDLISRGETARADLAAYERALLYPGNPTPAMVAQYGLDEFFAGTSCYGEYRKMLQKKGHRLEGWIQDLKKSRAVAGSLDSRSRSRQGGLDQAAAVVTVVRKTAGAAAPKGLSSHQQRNPGSTITGEIHDQESR